MRTLILALAMIATPAAAADQFDLLCTGIVKFNVFGKGEPTQMRYRVDLTTGSFCRGDCQVVSPISSVLEGLLIFDAKESSFRDRNKRSETVNRLTGAWRVAEDDGRGVGGWYMTTEGSCEPAPFSGLPSRKF